jgi:protein gp37
MGQKTSIEWCDHTFNPWAGCAKISPACKSCYAENISHRFGWNVWGTESPRRFFGDKHWNEPVKWDRAVKDPNKRPKVFCASMADVFELRSDLDVHRDRLWKLIEATPGLVWLLLTKRPENVKKIYGETLRANMWLGTTVENQKYTSRIESLLRINAPVRFLSCEPMLGPIDFNTCGIWHPGMHDMYLEGVHWVIAGGESGPGARQPSLDWYRTIRDQCGYAKVPFFFKQHGNWAPGANGLVRLRSKKDGGRLLDGVEHNGVPLDQNGNPR